MPRHLQDQHEKQPCADRCVAHVRCRRGEETHGQRLTLPPGQPTRVGLSFAPVLLGLSERHPQSLEVGLCASLEIGRTYVFLSFPFSFLPPSLPPSLSRALWGSQQERASCPESSLMPTAVRSLLSLPQRAHGHTRGHAQSLPTPRHRSVVITQTVQGQHPGWLSVGVVPRVNLDTRIGRTRPAGRRVLRLTVSQRPLPRSGYAFPTPSAHGRSLRSGPSPVVLSCQKRRGSSEP